MPDLREKFEAWTKTLPVEINLTRFEDTHYLYADTAERWEAYSAGYAEAVKDAEKACEGLSRTHSHWPNTAHAVIATLQYQIRALIPGDAP